MRTLLAVVLTALAVLLAGCSSTIKPDGAAKSVTDLVKQQTGFEPKDVKCPEGVKAKEGTTFECKFTGPEGKEYTADMRITKVDGDDVQFYIKTRPT
jgi:outer membrane murein-binding lipoprotein Lpp